MDTFFEEIKFPSKKEFGFIEITDQVKESVKRSGIKNGLVTLLSQHTTGGIRIGESEEGLMHDYETFFGKLVPKNSQYMHNTTNVDGRPNTHAHIQSLLVNSSETIPIKDGKLMLGKWHSIFFIEFDGKRPERKVTVQVIG